jgi:hypothetical protein
MDVSEEPPAAVVIALVMKAVSPCETSVNFYEVHSATSQKTIIIFVISLFFVTYLSPH